jgi:fumarate hydratase subunit beta
MLENLAKGIPLPMDPHGALIYYTGPTPPQPGKVIPSAGPTTAYRMDKYTPDMLRLGVKAVLGKGYRSDEVKAALLKYKGLYVTATGGAGAMLAQCIKAAEVIAYEDLGPEAIRKLTVENLPLQCIHDIYGGDQYYEGQKQWVQPDAMFQPKKPEAAE